MCVYNGFTLLSGRSQHNILKQLHFNKNFLNKIKIEKILKLNTFPYKGWFMEQIFLNPPFYEYRGWLQDF